MLFRPLYIYLVRLLFMAFIIEFKQLYTEDSVTLNLSATDLYESGVANVHKTINKVFSILICLLPPCIFWSFFLTSGQIAICCKIASNVEGDIRKWLLKVDSLCFGITVS
jgi:hypothetical protein